ETALAVEEELLARVHARTIVRRRAVCASRVDADLEAERAQTLREPVEPRAREACELARFRLVRGAREAVQEDAQRLQAPRELVPEELDQRRLLGLARRCAAAREDAGLDPRRRQRARRAQVRAHALEPGCGVVDLAHAVLGRAVELEPHLAEAARQ